MILTLDIAFASMGWAVMDGGKVVDCGTIKTEKSKVKTARVSDDRAWRCAQIAQALNKIIDENEVNAVIGEMPSGSQNAVACNMLGLAMGVVVGVVESKRLPAEWIAPTDSKKAAVGKRAASKEEMMDWCRKEHPYFEFPKVKSVFEHIADAVAAYNGLKPGMLVKVYG